MSIYATHEQNLQKARELLSKAKESNNNADAWALVDFLYDQMVLDTEEENNMNKNAQKMRVRDLIAMDIDIDVYDNVVEGIGIAFCGPVKLSNEGMVKFDQVMDYEITIYRLSDGCDVCIITTDDEEPEVPYTNKLRLAEEFFFACAGYCDSDNFDVWFVDED